MKLPVCGNCGKVHETLAEVTTCLYGGLPLKGGGVWTHETSKEVWKRVADNLDRVVKGGD